ncbi:large ribosomal subunit protein uL2m-like [Palaemon carinicauda]|uniref:large ribosomal subunit protein uL2m-like n=1 Tax=Palaemon carinicauda TaxID=392227 RepID=UPI0035B5B60A
MAAIGTLCQRFAAFTLKSPVCGVARIAASTTFLQDVRFYNVYQIDRPKPGTKRNLKFLVHYPEDKEYTVKPLKMTKLAGRDPDTGRIIHGALGGGQKRNYRWIHKLRVGPTDGTFLEERVLKILYDPNRSGRIALVGCGDELRYRMATDGMQVGDLIKTSSYIPRIPVRPKDGDAYPLGALPMFTNVCCVELNPGEGSRIVHAAGTTAIVKRKMDDKIVIQLPSKREMALDARCMATVGRISNVDHGKQHIGSAQRSRWLGNRPSSGLWQRKDGHMGRKLKAPKPVLVYSKKKPPLPTITLTLTGERHPGKLVPSTDRIT